MSIIVKEKALKQYKNFDFFFQHKQLKYEFIWMRIGQVIW